MNTAPIKVAHVTTVDISLRDLLLHQMLSLRGAGYEVTGISAPGEVAPVIEASGIRHIAVPMSRNLTPFADLVSLWRLYRVMRRERFTIIHTHTPKAGLLGQLAARLAGVPIVVNTVHGFYFHEHMRLRARRFYVAMEKVAAWCSHLILSQNAEDMQTAVKEGICRPAAIKFLGNGIDLTQYQAEAISREDEAQWRKKLGIAPDAPVVGFVGRLAARRKGFLDFLAAAKQVAAQMPAARFLVVGDADLGKPDAVDPSVAADYGIAERCVFLGFRPNAELPPYYKVMDVMVLPSLFEGVPRVVMEAAAMGTPCIVSDVKGNREAVVNERTGLIVPLGDVPAITSAIMRVLTQPGLAGQMGEEARRLAAERFDERMVFERVKTEYRRLLDLHDQGLPLGPERAALVRNIFRRLKKQGLASTFHLAVARLRSSLRSFLEDRRRGVSTTREMKDGELGIQDLRNHWYVATDYETFRLALREVSVRSGEDVFVDFGSGMGRMVLLAAEQPFRRVIGVEFSRQLHDIALANLSAGRATLKCQDVELIHADATQWEVPDEANVLFFFNPFDGEVLAKVCAQIRQSLGRAPRKLTMIYVRADKFFEKEIAWEEWLVKKAELPCLEGKVAIYQSKPVTGQERINIESAQASPAPAR